MSDHRKVIEALHEAVSDWLIRYGYSVAKEIGLLSLGSLRADLLGVNLRSRITIIEIKASWADFTGDHKWEKYLDYADRFYFAVPLEIWRKHRIEIVDKIGNKAGVIYLGEDGYAKVCYYAPSGNSTLTAKERLRIVTRLAWRQGLSKRQKPRRTRRYLVKYSVDAHRS